MNLVQSRHLDVNEDGFAVDVSCLDSGSQSIVVYATLYGSLVGWDLRAPGVAWRLENGLRKGHITTFCVDAHQSWLTLGTSNGYHTTWDLRFQLPITSIEHPSGLCNVVFLNDIRECVCFCGFFILDNFKLFKNILVLLIEIFIQIIKQAKCFCLIFN